MTAMQIDSERIRIDLPTGWEGEVYRTSAVPQAEGTNRAVLHAATFPLPAERGDYGGGAVETMRSDDIFLSLFEFEPASAGKVLFAAGRPDHLDPDDFSTSTLQRLIPGQSGVQRFFSERGRAFCLYVVLGSHASRRALVEEVNRLLATLEVDP
jgi:hypothetical protein